MGARKAVAPGVGDLDAEGVRDDVERELEVAPRHPAVGDRIGGQLGHDVRRRVEREPPRA